MPSSFVFIESPLESEIKQYFSDMKTQTDRHPHSLSLLSSSPWTKQLTPKLRDQVLDSATATEGLYKLMKYYNVAHLANEPVQKFNHDNIEFQELSDRFNAYMKSSSQVCQRDIANVGLRRTASLLSYMFLAEHYKALQLSPFILGCVQLDIDTQEYTNQLLFRAFAMSRFHYILHGTYLPLVITVGFTVHATCCLYLPSSNTPGLWHAIFIDSANTKASSKDFYQNQHKQYEKAEDYVARKWNTELSKTQRNVPFLQFKHNDCSERLQSKLPTCASWSYMLSLMFLIHWKYIVNKLETTHKYFIINWCNKLRNVTSHKNMHHFIDIFIHLRKNMFTHFYRMLVDYAWNRRLDLPSLVSQSSRTERLNMIRPVLMSKTQQNPIQALTHPQYDENELNHFIKTCLWGFSSKSGYDVTPKQDQRAQRKMEYVLDIIQKDIHKLAPLIKPILRFKQTPSPRQNLDSEGEVDEVSRAKPKSNAVSSKNTQPKPKPRVLLEVD